MTRRETRLEAVCRALVAAYARGAEDEQMDWSDIDQAHEMAVAALKLKRIKRRPMVVEIHVSGGVAEVVKSPRGVEVQVLDLDAVEVHGEETR